MKKYLLYTAACLLALTSCDLDINDNPNYPSSGAVTADLIFPAAENAVADVVGDQLFNSKATSRRTSSTVATDSSMPARCKTSMKS